MCKGVWGNVRMSGGVFECLGCVRMREGVCESVLCLKVCECEDVSWCMKVFRE